MGWPKSFCRVNLQAIILGALIIFSVPFALGKSNEKIEILKKRTIKVGNKKILVEVADNDRDRARGLMFRESLPKDEGMLFIFDEPEPLAFWMKNTLIPLSIGFFSKDRRLINVLEMRPMSPLEKEPKHYRSEGLALYALEMNEGWFKKNNLGPGATIDLGK